jgi:hypothetical protein
MSGFSKLVIFPIADGSCPAEQPHVKMVKKFKFLILAIAGNVCVVMLVKAISKLVKFLKFSVEEGIVMDKSHS